MANEVDWELYQYLNDYCQEEDKQIIIDGANDSITRNLKNNPSYRADALCNGEPQPILATRTEPRSCNVTLIPGDTIFIGDLIFVFNEYWVCMEAQTDEYGITSAVLWLCNQIFRFQNHSSEIIEKYAIIDDGSYSKGTDKDINITSNNYTCYMSYDEESSKLFVDKRLAIDVVYDSQGKQIIDVGKITWIDKKTNNLGAGSHLLKFRLENDVYNPEKDNIEEMVCNYITDDYVPEPSNGALIIEGRDALRIGTGRTYKVSVVDSNGVSVEAPTGVSWSITAAPGVTLEENGDTCIVRVALQESLIGERFTLTCIDTNGDYEPANKEVAVITFG